jgi:putative component of membrane protein insertase Oxa1/YidC/SpoIIIJ protein YidD
MIWRKLKFYSLNEFNSPVSAVKCTHEPSCSNKNIGSGMAQLMVHHASHIAQTKIYMEQNLKSLKCAFE